MLNIATVNTPHIGKHDWLMRESLAMAVDQGIKGGQVAEVLDRIVAVASSQGRRVAAGASS